MRKPKSNGHLVYMVKWPLFDRDLERFGLLHFYQENYQITIVDLSLILHPEIPFYPRPERLPNDIEVLQPKTWSEFNTFGRNISSANLIFFFFQSFGFSRQTFRPLRLIAQIRVPYAIQGISPLPGVGKNDLNPRLFELSVLFKRFIHMNLKNSLVARLKPQWFGIPMAKYALVPCEEKLSISGNSLVDEKTKIIPLHTDDFERFRNFKIHKKKSKKKAVFLDQNMVYHLDYIEINAKPIDENKYFEALRSAFSAIEEKTGLSIEIAKHPRAKYEDYDPRFGSRPIFSDQTIEMVRDSDLVLAHHSTAISFAVLLQKPIAILVTQDMYTRHPVDKNCFNALTAELGTELRYIDDLDSDTFENLFKVDLTLYAQYISRYLRHPNACDKSYWDLVSSSITEFKAT